MPDDPHELRRVNLSEVFPFTQLFRSFRLAIHLNKLGLALLAVILTYALGRVMDTIWPPTAVMPPSMLQAALPTGQSLEATTEIGAFLGDFGGVDLCTWCSTARDVAAERQAVLLNKIKPKTSLEEARKKAAEGRARDEIRRAAGEARDAAEVVLRPGDADVDGVYKRLKGTEEAKAGPLWKAYETVCVAALVGQTRKVNQEAGMAALGVLAKNKDICGQDDQETIAKAIQANATVAELNLVTGRGIFGTLLNHEIATFRDALRSMLALETGIGTRPATGLKAALVSAIGGICWLFYAHWLYAVIFTALALLVWSLFGGAICRIAALHAARDEKISFKQSLAFSGRKLLSFFSAPLIPVALIIVIGGVVFVGGLISAIPVVGEIFAGLLWPLALLGGFVMALVLIGTVAGSMLMFPTIAVEGSDSFDALSRSFSYVYSKPWRTAFYVLIAGLYGAICYLFVRLFAHLVLNLVHVSAGLGMNVDGSGRLPETVGKLDAIWTRTAVLESDRFFGAFHQYPLSGTEAFAGFFITVWTFIVVGLVVSFAISFFFSASTMIYYLLRREVDATDIEDVYLEEFEEEIAPITTPPAEGEVEAQEGDQLQRASDEGGDSSRTDEEDKPSEGN